VDVNGRGTVGNACEYLNTVVFLYYIAILMQ